MHRPAVPVLLATLLLGLAACGGHDAAPAATVITGPAPPLASEPHGSGEIVLRAPASPRRHGPLVLDGRYRVRFVQYAPEDPNLDFAAQTAFVADLQTPGGARVGRLFRAAAAQGATTIDVHGRFLVDVSFGDFPYVLRFTPLVSK